MEFKLVRINRILLIVLAILVLIYIVMKVSDTGKNIPELLFGELKMEDITSITIKHGQDRIELKKQSDTWFVKGEEFYKANENLVKDLIAALEKSRKEATVTTNPEKYKNFNLDIENRKVISLSDSNQQMLLHLNVGKIGPDYRSSYVIVGEEKEVSLVNYNFNTFIRTRANDYRDKVIWTIDRERITGIRLNRTQDIILLEKEDGLWKLKQGEGSILAKNSVVTDIINKVANLTCADFELEKTVEECGLESPERELSIILNDGTSKDLLIGSKTDKNQYYIMTSDTDDIYIVFNWTVGFFEKNLEDFIQKEQPQ